MTDPAAPPRPLTTGEEIANSVTHGIGLLASVVAFPFLVVAAARRWGAPEVVGASVFAATLVALYLFSTLYHALRPSRAKQVLQKLDHTAIYLKVAVALYVVMGWLVVVAARPLLASVPWPGLAWLAAGGLLYTGGIAFYAAKRVRWAHTIWHLFVLAGSACHFVAIWGWSGRA